MNRQQQNKEPINQPANIKFLQNFPYNNTSLIANFSSIWTALSSVSCFHQFAQPTKILFQRYFSTRQWHTPQYVAQMSCSNTDINNKSFPSLSNAPGYKSSNVTVWTSMPFSLSLTTTSQDSVFSWQVYFLFLSWSLQTCFNFQLMQVILTPKEKTPNTENILWRHLKTRQRFIAC